LPITSNPKNLKSSSRISDPLAPYSLSTRIIAEILVIDPTQMKSLNEGYTPYLNFSGLDAKIFERLNEKRKFKKGGIRHKVIKKRK